MSHSSNADADSLCGWVCKSTRRLKAMAVLLRQPNTVKGIATRTNLHKSHLSSALSKLVDKGLVESKSLGRKKLFSLTEKRYNIAKSAPVLNLYFHKGLVSNVKSVLNELSIPYARNVKLKANNNKDVAEFVILDGPRGITLLR